MNALVSPVRCQPCLLRSIRLQRRILHERNLNIAAPLSKRSRPAAWPVYSAAILSAAILGAVLYRDRVQLEAPKSGQLISYQELQKHNTRDDVWVSIEGKVYDVTDWIQYHPGGASVVLKLAGKDATRVFKPIHPPNTIQDNLGPDAYKGDLDRSTLPEQSEEPSDEELIAERRKQLPPLGAMINLDDFERAAESVLGPDSQAWAYYRSAADDESAYDRNRSGFSFLHFIPRILRPVSKVDTSAKFLGQQVPLPIYISPAAMARLGHPDGELNLTKCASAVNGVQGISFNASCSLDEMFQARDEARMPNNDATLWYQIYLNPDRTKSENALRKAVAGGATAIILTVDCPVPGKRERDLRAKGDFGDGSEEDSSVSSILNKGNEADLRWEDMDWIKSVTNLPVLIKGIQSVADADLAYQKGASAVILSNHGGRQLDHAPASIATLVRMHLEAPHLLRRPDFDVYLDGGIRRGSDVVKALCLGAKGAGLGRPFLFAQTCYGAAGAQRVYQIMEQEIQTTMRLCGATKISDLKPEMIELLDGLLGKQLKSIDQSQQPTTSA